VGGPRAEAGVEEPAIEAVLQAIRKAVEAGIEPAVEARADHVSKAPAHALGLKLAGGTQPYQEG
jgi:hypothetical protein